MTGLAVLDSTWVSDQTGWVLGDSTCSGAPCRVVFHTADRGGTWDEITAPPPTPNPLRLAGLPCAGCIDHVRFADPRIGYAYSNTELDTGGVLDVTTDGGGTWRKDAAPAIIEALEISGRTAVRVVSDGGGCPAACNVRVESSPVGSNAWRPLPAPSVSEGKGDGLVAHDSRIYVLGFGNPAGGVVATTEVARSQDRGATWQTSGDPCGTLLGGEADARRFAAAPGGFLAVLCIPRSAGDVPPYVVTSADSGAAYGPRHPLPVPAGSMDLGFSVGSATNIAAIIDVGVTPTVLVFHDGGASWKPTLAAPAAVTGSVGPDFLGFQDAHTARAAFQTGPLWTTTDAGNTWQRSDIVPSGKQ